MAAQQQRAQYMKFQQASNRQPIPKATAEENWSRLPDNVHRLYEEAARDHAAKVPTVTLTPDQKNHMAQQLRACTDMLSRMDVLVNWVAKFPGHEKTLNGLVRMVRE